jgi:hypothetical protein
VKQRVTIYWLVPAKPYLELFESFIAILGRDLDAPDFAPHVTLCRPESPKLAERVLRRIKAPPVRLRATGVVSSGKFTKALFVRFAPNDKLKLLVRALGGDEASLKDPHLSLLYKRLPAETKRQLAATIKLPFRHVVFDVVKAVTCASPTETREDVERWRVIATKRLIGERPRHARDRE